MTAKLLIFALAVLFGVVAVNLTSAQFDELPSAPLRVTESASYPEFSYSILQAVPDAGGFYHSPNQGFEAQHGASCGGPIAGVPHSFQTHHVINYEDMVYVCNGHVMTALDGGTAQATLVLTPNKVLDWTNGPATFQFEMSTKLMSNRDWTDFVVVPFEWAHGGWIEVDRMPKTAIQVFGHRWSLRYVKDFVMSAHGGGNLFIGSPVVAGTNQSAARQPFKFTISKTHMKMEMLQSTTNRCAPSCVFFDVDVPDTQATLGMTKGVVQIGQHSYNPTKGVEHGEDLSVLGEGKPATWHWDEFKLECNPSPCQNINFIRADKRSSPAAASGPVWTDTITFASAAPAGAYLRFNSIGTVVRLSFNNGTTWQDARCVEITCAQAHMSSFFHPVPQGTRSVRFYSEEQRFGQTVGRDFELWSLGGQQVPTATPTQPATVVVPATFTPVRTFTPVPTLVPTNTPQPPAPTNTPQATPTIMPTNTAQPAVTPTPTLVGCEVFTRSTYNNGTIIEAWTRAALAICQGGQ